MEALREYLLGVIAAALICGLVTSLLGSTGAAGLIRLICGIFLTVTVLSPAARLDMDALLSLELPQMRQAKQETRLGQEMARRAFTDGIKQQLEAYVLDKAPDLPISVEVTLSDDEIPVPVGIAIQGPVSPYDRARLKNILTEDLGIPEEEQQWIG